MYHHMRRQRNVGEKACFDYTGKNNVQIGHRRWSEIIGIIPKKPNQLFSSKPHVFTPGIFFSTCSQAEKRKQKREKKATEELYKRKQSVPKSLQRILLTKDAFPKMLIVRRN